MRGRAALTQSMTAWCLYLAFWPLWAVSLAPANSYSARALKGQPIANPNELAAQISPGDLLVLLVCFVASTVVLVLFARGVLRTLRALHGLTVPKSIAAVLLAIVGCTIFLMIIALPFARSIYW